MVTMWLSTSLATQLPIMEQCLLGAGRIGIHVQLCTAACLRTEMCMFRLRLTVIAQHREK